MINFFCEDIDFKVHKPNFLKKWLKESAINEGYTVKDLNYIFCSDDYLHKINLEYLDHDTLTDIITFDNSEKDGKIEGDIFISIDRVKDNAKDFSTEFDHELRRVLVHGLLHLCGYLDETDEEEAEMRTKENEYLSKYTN
ncbi:MAG: rRNA maturation RNase YbeY [Spirosomataceae bacterium]